MNKTELRKIYLQKRKSLSSQQVRTRSLDLLNQLKKTDIFQKKTFHVFLPIKKNNEVFTWFIIAFLWSKGKRVVVSKSNFDDKTMEHFVLEKQTRLKKNKYGIPEPVSAQKISLDRIEVVFVPMLICDRRKNRVGYGKGFYDRFLALCQADTLFVGLNFFAPIGKISNVSLSDIPMTMVFTNH